MTSRGRTWQRRYPPLLTVVLAIALVALVMPSALRLPQSNPREVPEFAPVPGQQQAGQAGASFDGLGAAAGPDGGPAAGPGSGTPPTPPPLQGIGKNPVGKQCVGNPPRQTEDKLSPPCVAYFKGDNGGATYRGVTRDEVTVVLYMGSATATSSSPACGTFVDLASGQVQEPAYLGWAQAYARYFNDRYQTYGRFVHLWAQGAHCGTPTSVTRRADAERAHQRLRPFAAVMADGAPDTQPYLESMSGRGVLVFLNPRSVVKPQSYLARNAGLVWGYNPTVEQAAHMYARLVCRQVVPFRASFSGNVGENGEPRKLGQLYADDPDVPELAQMSRLIAAQVKACGGNITATHTVSKARPEAAAAAGDTGPNREVAQAVAAFKAAGVTTVLWTGLSAASPTIAASSIQYRPEWIVISALDMDKNDTAALENQDQWSRAWVVTQATYVADYNREECTQSARNTDPTLSTLAQSYRCEQWYIPLRQLFTGIQVAGPRLTPQSMDEGFHAIPAIASTDASIPACFYLPGDYSCVKDAMAEWWDPTGPATGTYGTKGCYRVPDRAARYVLGDWPRHNLGATKTANDPCNRWN